MQGRLYGPPESYDFVLRRRDLTGRPRAGEDRRQPIHAFQVDGCGIVRGSLVSLIAHRIARTGPLQVFRDLGRNPTIHAQERSSSLAASLFAGSATASSSSKRLSMASNPCT